jgi:aldose 1-epimerase
MAASGEQWTIEHGEQTATIVEVGGGLRTYRVADRDVVAGYGEDEMCSSGRGQLLLPWPNRIRDGRYEFGGTEHQLTLSEPANGNASHGLVRWANWRLLEQDAARVRVGIRLHPQPGWPGLLDLATSWELGEHGLEVTMTADNVGDDPVPFGAGAHPYVAIGDTPRDHVLLRVPAKSYVTVDERKLPTGAVSVERTDYDFRIPRPLWSAHLDTAFGDLERDGDGRWRVTVADVRVWGDEAFGWVQVFTDKAADDAAQATRGIAVEPVTCPPDAFNSGLDLVVLEPGEQWRGHWGIEPVDGGM